MSLKYASICSGIEAASVAWHPLGWEPVFFSEIEGFPCAALKHHYPTTPNLGDMTKWRDWPEELLLQVDVLVAGTPCQAFSVAGLRKSLDDARGNLTLELVHIFNKINQVRRNHGRAPATLLWENVPGVLSTKDNALGCFFGALLGCDDAPEVEGGKWDPAGILVSESARVGWRVLDAQFFGVAQRRRRVFVIAVASEVVASTGGRACPSKILPLPESSSRHPATERAQGEGTPGAAKAGAGGGGWPAELASTLNAHFGSKQGLEDQHVLGGAPLFVPDVVGAPTAKGPDGLGAPQVDAQHYVLATGQVNAPVTKDVCSSLTLNSDKPIVFSKAKRARSKDDDETWVEGEVSPTLNKFDQGETRATTICITGSDIYNGAITGDVAATITKASGGVASTGPSVIVGSDLYTPDLTGEVAATITKSTGGAACTGPSVLTGYAENFKSIKEVEISPAMTTSGLAPTQNAGGLLVPGQTAQLSLGFNWANGGGYGDAHPGLGITEEGTGPLSTSQVPAVASKTYLPGVAMQVRRLTPMECERLQGFPDGYTQIPYRGKPASACPDGPRYAALGNSFCVLVVRWIGWRIDQAMNGTGA